MSHKVVHILNARKQEGGTYVGRGRGSKWGNPFKVTTGRFARQRACAQFKQYIKSKPALIERAKRELGGKDLVCWCSPLQCHAETLADLANPIDTIIMSGSRVIKRSLRIKKG